MSQDVTDAVIRAVAAPPLKQRGYALDPAAKAGLMKPEAGPLARVLTDRALASLVTGYARDDEAAVEAQKRYRRWNWAAIGARYGIIILGILALSFTQGLRRFVGEDLGLWLSGAIVFQLVLLLAALVIVYVMRRKRLLQGWMRRRAFAEAKRLAFFDCIMQREQVATEGELPLLALKLEFVVRYLLEPQLDYFKRRGRQLGRGTGLNRTSLLILGVVISYTLIQIVLGLAVLLGLYTPSFTFDPELALARALIGAAFAVLLASTTMAQLDERNALRYEQTAANLETLLVRYLPAIRDSAVAGDTMAVDSFVRLVTEQVGYGAADWLSIDELKAIAAEVQPTRSGVDMISARRFLLALGLK